MNEEESKKYEEAARQAAATGDAEGMVAALYKSRFLDGLIRRTTTKWDVLNEDDAKDVVASAVDELYAAVRAGKRIANVLAYLIRMTNYIAFDAAKAKKSTIPFEPDLHGGADGSWRSIGDEAVDERDAVEVAAREKNEGLARIRPLLAMLGQQRMTQVMTFIFGKVGEGAVDVSEAEIADALKMTIQNVRTQKSRGFQRLRELAGAHGITLRGHLPETRKQATGKPRGRPRKGGGSRKGNK